MWRLGVLGAVLVVGGCVEGTKADGPLDSGADSGEQDSGDATFGDDDAQTSDDGATPATDTGGTDADPDDDGNTFIVDMTGDDPDIAVACDVWTQDCPEDEKCTAYIQGGGNAWNATQCVPVAANPSTVGSTCTAENAATGEDDCDYGSMCWGVGEDGLGYCVALCTGNSDSPICEDSDTSCVIVNEGVLNLCLPNCHPLLQDCEAEGESCYPTPGDSFACAPNVAGDTLPGDPCSGINTCPEGTYCATADVLPVCDGPACCTPFCDTDEADDSCGDEGAECVPAFDEGQAPPGFQNLGACVLP